MMPTNQEKTQISIVKTHPQAKYSQIRQAVQQSLGLIGGIRDIVKPDDLALINPSWVAPPVEREAGCIDNRPIMFYVDWRLDGRRPGLHHLY
ncbi:hypothetical protein D1BOALGB6SA_6736 [Olavius sp. associated proteobacterium Delta 1]|nr:hypothetical protein D1BOALGB6SA_6736 [Olavius sp. associated proteobacterium Delta 1]